LQAQGILDELEGARLDAWCRDFSQGILPCSWPPLRPFKRVFYVPPAVNDKVTPSLCFKDHPSVRDIVVVLNYNTWGDEWGYRSYSGLISFYRHAFPLVVAYAPAEAPQKDMALPRSDPKNRIEVCNSYFYSVSGFRQLLCVSSSMLRHRGHLGFVSVSSMSFSAPRYVISFLFLIADTPMMTVYYFTGIR
jgi:hypothetical protein